MCLKTPPQRLARCIKIRASVHTADGGERVRSKGYGLCARRRRGDRSGEEAVTVLFHVRAELNIARGSSQLAKWRISS